MAQPLNSRSVILIPVTLRGVGGGVWGDSFLRCTKSVGLTIFWNGPLSHLHVKSISSGHYHGGHCMEVEDAYTSWVKVNIPLHFQNVQRHSCNYRRINILLYGKYQ